MTNFAAGARALATGFGVLVRRPKLLVLGAVPALVSTVLLLGLLGVLLYNINSIVDWVTPFADGWPEFVRGAFQATIGLVIVGAAALGGSLSFIALTLLIGAPFYEHIAERVEQDLGLDVSADGAGWVSSFVRGIVDSVKLVLIALVGAVVLFFLGFIPVLGQTVIPVVGVLFGAWVLTLEMVGLVFQRRGLRLGDRHRTLREHRAAVFGFGLPTYLLCLIPVVQLVVIPSATVGGVMLAHRFLGPVSAKPQPEPPRRDTAGD